MSLRRWSPAEREELYHRIEAGQVGIREGLRELRRSMALSQRAYARMVGVAPRIVIEFESGRGNPTIQTLDRLFKPLGLELGLRRRTNADST